MKRNFLRLLFVVSFFLTGKTTMAQWSAVSPSNPVGTGRPTKFVIGDTIYYGNGDDGGFHYVSSFYTYTTQSNSWQTIANCPNGGGDQGFQFVINDTAYVGDGASPGFHNNFFGYTPSAGWFDIGGAHPSAVPPGGGRAFTCGFSIGEKGYFGTGLPGNNVPFADFYEYNPSAFTWTPKHSLPHATFGGVAFSANGKGYMGLGYRNQVNDSVYNDMFQYDPITDTWDTMAPLPASVGMGEAEPAYFVQCGKLVVTLGQTLHSTTMGTNQTWMFDPTDGPKGKWYQLPDCPAYLAYSPGGMALRDTGYVVGGADPLNNYNGYKQMFRFIPNINPITVSPNITTCLGTSVTLTADGGGAFKWSPTAGLSDSITTSTQATGGLTSVTANPSVTTTYTVTEAVCGQTATVVVSVGSLQADSVKATPPSICSGQTSSLTVSGSGNFTWSPSAGLNNDTTGNIVVATPLVTTTYTVTSGNGSCSFTDTVVVTVGNNAVGGLVAAVRDTLCQNTPGNLSISGNSNNTLQWQLSINDTDFANAVNDTLLSYKTPPLQQTTWYRVMVGKGNCSAISDTLRLYVPPPLVASFYFTQPSPNQLAFNSDSSSGKIRSYHWDFGDGGTSNDSNPSYTYAKDSTYYVCLTLFDGSNCSYTFCRYSEVTDGIPTVSAAGNWIIYPNPFSEQLTVSSKQFNDPIQSIQMYDVLGQLVINKNLNNETSNSLQFDVSSLSKGMYYVMIRTADADYVQKVVKQ